MTLPPAPLPRAAAIWRVRALTTTPANLLGPVELAEQAAELGRRHGAAVTVSADAALESAWRQSF